MSHPYLITLEQFKTLLKGQNCSIEHVKFECPMCGTHQCAQDFIDAGAGKNLDDVERFLAFSCIGRWTGQDGPPPFEQKAADNKGCNWTLGGFLNFHELGVSTPDGKIHPRFKPINFEPEMFRDSA